MTRRSVLLRVVALLLVSVATLAGCVRLPQSGPIVAGGSQGDTEVRPPSDIDAEPPQHGASQLDVVDGFLEAMTAWPVKTSVAKQYLTSDAARQWNPRASTIVYSDFAPPSEETGGVTVRLSGASRLDSAGAWRGGLPEDQQTLRLKVVREHGEFRIADPPNAMVVPATWFQQRFGQVSLYYFESDAKFLVPEPVFVPLGDQLPTALISALLAGPPKGLDGVVRTFVPAGLSVGLSVPVSGAGVADITLVGEQTEISSGESSLLLAQLAATLRQDTDITGFRVTINAHPLQGSVDRVFPVDLGDRFSATDQQGPELYGVEHSRLVSGDPGRMLPVAGPFGTGEYVLNSIAVQPGGDRAVAVTDGGRTALLAPISSEPHPAVRTLLLGATSLARPTVDLAGRVWLVDRRSRGAVVYCAEDGRTRVVQVPGVTGRDVRRILVSTDGTRLLAVVREPHGDAVVGTRVVTSLDGRVRGVVDPFRIPTGGPGRQVLDIGWASPSRLAILMPTRPHSLYQVDIVPADGSTIGADTLSTVLGGRVTGLAGSSDQDQPTYAVLKESLIDVRTRLSTELADRASEVSYAG